MTAPPLFNELNGLVQSIAKALDVSEMSVVEAFEQNLARISFSKTSNGQNIIEVSIGGKSASIGIEVSQI